MSDFFELQELIRNMRPGTPGTAMLQSYSYSTPTQLMQGQCGLKVVIANYGTFTETADTRPLQDIDRLFSMVNEVLRNQNIIINFLQHQFDAK